MNGNKINSNLRSMENSCPEVNSLIVSLLHRKSTQEMVEHFMIHFMIHVALIDSADKRMVLSYTVVV